MNVSQAAKQALKCRTVAQSTLDEMNESAQTKEEENAIAILQDAIKAKVVRVVG